MKIHAKEIIDQMSPAVLSEVQKAAKDKGVSVDQFVAEQLSAQLVEDELVMNVQKADWDVSADHSTDRGTTVRGSIGWRF